MNGYPADQWRQDVHAALNTLKRTTTVLNGPMAPKDAVRFTGHIVEACRELDHLMRHQPDEALAADSASRPHQA